MRITRLISRRFWRLLTYLFIGALIIVVPATLTFNKYSSSKPGRNSPESDFPGALVAEEIPVGIPRADVAWPYGSGPKKDWHNHEQMRLDALRQGPGEQGAAFKLPTDDDTVAKADALYRANGYSALVSDKIALNRSIKDIRHPGCKTKSYLAKLPTATIILPFHDEHYTVLLRSCYSIINRSPAELLKEIILVDDASTKPELLKDGKLEQYLAANIPIVRIVHTSKREGLIRARQVGARAAGNKADVIIFLDAHSEANHNWLPPLLEPIAEDYRTAVCPFVDVVDCETFEYKPQDEGARGSFDWEFNYKRLPLTKKDKENPTEPFNSPVMAGGYFAISTRWFWELGGYDEGLDIWGGEQYELSFKIWQCHGRMVDTACSRVGHIYRCKYTPFPNPGVGDFISRNYKRVAEVWMDEYKEYIFERRPSVRTVEAGDLTKQKAVRDRLKCKSFQWFMTEVAFDQEHFYPAKEPPDGATGHLKPVADEKLCVDAQYRDKNVAFGMRECGLAGAEQHFRLTWYNDIRPKDRSSCFDVSTSQSKAPVVMFPCHGMHGNQKWVFDETKKQLFHPVSHLCLDSDVEKKEIFMSECDPEKKTQQWVWDTVRKEVLQKWRDEPRRVD